MTIHCTDEKSMMTFLLWTDPFQPASDWWGACYTMGGEEDNGCIVTDGIGG